MLCLRQSLSAFVVGSREKNTVADMMGTQCIHNAIFISADARPGPRSPNSEPRAAAHGAFVAESRPRSPTHADSQVGQSIIIVYGMLGVLSRSGAHLGQTGPSNRQGHMQKRRTAELHKSDFCIQLCGSQNLKIPNLINPAACASSPRLHVAPNLFVNQLKRLPKIIRSC
jgi:hypothetical protein